MRKRLLPARRGAAPAAAQLLALLRGQKRVNALLRLQRCLEHLLAQFGHRVKGLARRLLVEFPRSVRLLHRPALLVHRYHQRPVLAENLALDLGELRTLLGAEIQAVKAAVAAHHPEPHAIAGTEATHHAGAHPIAPAVAAHHPGTHAVAWTVAAHHPGAHAVAWTVAAHHPG